MKLLLSTLVLIASTCYSQTYTEIFKAAAFDRESEDRMGYSVDISGNYAIIGAYADDFGAVDPNMGSAYIFEKTGIEDWTFVQKINNSDQDDYDRFGWSVAIHGDFAVIGAYAEDHDENDENSMSKAGSAYIFERGADGVWTEMQKIVPSDREADDEFGWSVDIYDNTVVVGAHHQGYDEFGGDFEYHAGAMYVFDLDVVDGTWEETQKIVPSHRADDHVYPSGRPDPDDEDFSDLFGGSVAIWGDYIVAGAHMHDYGAAGPGTGYLWNAGKAFVFERSGGVWSETEVLLPAIRKAYDRFGYAVDIDDDVIVIGVYSEDESEFEAAPLMNAGAAYIFERDGAGDWTQTQKLDASDRTAGDHFGRDVAIDDNYLVIGAEQEDLNEDGDPDTDSISNAGAAYIFEKDVDGTWSEIQKIVNSHRAEDDLFGDAVAISEHTILVGAWQQDYDSVGADYTEDAGAAYFYSAVLCEEEYTDQDITICAGESVIVGENVYDMSGEYIDTLLNVDACDSIVTTNLTVIEPVFASQDISICFGTTFTVGDSVYDASGTYENTLIAVLTGCDSIVTTNLVVEEENTFEQEFTICAGESIVVGESTYDESGEYVDILISATMCDSIVTTTLEVLPVIDVSIAADGFTLTGGDPDVEPTSFQWIKCDPYEVIDGADERSYTAEEDGDYAIIITIDDCADTSDCYSILGVGIDEFETTDIQIYPNPNSGLFTIQVGDYNGDDLNLTVIDHLGAVIYEEKMINHLSDIELRDVASGVYFVRITNGESTVVKKLTIQ